MEQAERRQKKKKYDRRISLTLEQKQLNLIDELADHTNEERSSTIREALEIGVKRLQKRHGVTHG